MKCYECNGEVSMVYEYNEVFGKFKKFFCSKCGDNFVQKRTNEIEHKMEERKRIKLQNKLGEENIFVCNCHMVNKDNPMELWNGELIDSVSCAYCDKDGK